MEKAGTKTFDAVFNTELRAIADRHNGIEGREKISSETSRTPTTELGLTGLACSGGGIRSAAFCLGVLQGLQSKDVIDRIDYLSTVSGGGYIGSTLSIGMASGPDAADPDAKVNIPKPRSDNSSAGELRKPAKKEALFPFGRLDDADRESPEVKHLRDNSRYLLQNGLPGVISAAVIYLRGLAMNTLVILPFLVVAAAALISLNPTTQDLVTNNFFGIDVTPLVGTSRIPATIIGAFAIAALLVIYAVLVSVLRIRPISERRSSAKFAGWIFAIVLLVSLVELHAALLRLIFEAEGLIKLPAQPDRLSGAEIFKFLYGAAEKFVTFVSPLVVAALPFWKTLAAKASQEASGWQESAKQLASQIILILAAALVPILLWLVMMQLAYWGTAVSTCKGGMLTADCAAIYGWQHAPTLFQTLADYTAGFQEYRMPLIYGLAAAVLFLSWFILSVNSNSLHQLYRDRLGGAFLIRRRRTDDKKDLDADLGDVVRADDFSLTALDPKRGPYHIINTALNVPGSRFANRRGRNADFFIFSKCFIGSEITGYVETDAAEKVVDGLNVGTAMAISGAAAAPNMGLASIRPLSATIAFLNVRLGRWVRHPHDIAHMYARLPEEAREAAPNADEAAKAETPTKANEAAAGGLLAIRRFPGPKYLLQEAFFKSGRNVTIQRELAGQSGKEAETDGKKTEGQETEPEKAAETTMGFVFLTDGGHIENLGIYELLRRRCKLIIAIDGEADPDIEGPSLTQLERLARIDHNISLRMQWKPIGEITRAVSSSKSQPPKSGPHVALGLIDYPPPQRGKPRETGVLIYIKASLSGDENDYVMAYNALHRSFPHESTADQLFSEEQFEVYRALGEHIAIGFVTGRDPVSVDPKNEKVLVDMVKDGLKIWDSPA